MWGRTRWQRQGWGGLGALCPLGSWASCAFSEPSVPFLQWEPEFRPPGPCRGPTRRSAWSVPGLTPFLPTECSQVDHCDFCVVLRDSCNGLFSPISSIG